MERDGHWIEGSLSSDEEYEGERQDGMAIEVTKHSYMEKKS